MKDKRQSLTVKEATVYANVHSNKTIYEWFKQGLPSYYANGRRVYADEIDKFRAKRTERVFTGIRAK